MAVNSAGAEEKNVGTKKFPTNCSLKCEGALSVPLLSDGGNKSPKCVSESLLGVPGLKNSQMCLDAHQNCQNVTSVKVDIMDIYVSSTLDNDIEKGKLEMPKSNAEANLKTEDCLPYFQRFMQREIASHVGGKLMHLLMNSSLELPKFTSRDICVTPTSRSRKYKRSVSFNSRRVVFLFSILSIMGTIILIYLTLRVRLISDASVNV